MTLDHFLPVDGALQPAFLQTGGQCGIGIETAFGHTGQESARQLVVEHAVPTDGELRPYSLAGNGA
jgi:hypothetical protein